jgi:hypothetical protein
MLGITRNEILLGLAFAIVGFFASMRGTIFFLNGLDPIVGVIVYYAILYITMFILAHFGLVIWKFNIKTPIQTLGLLLITFAFFLVVDWESCYVNTVIHGSCSMTSSLYFASEDGATYYFWDTFIGVKNPEISRYFTYVLTPFLLVMLGGAMVKGKIKLRG